MELESSLFPLRKQELLDHHMDVVNLFSGFVIFIWQSTQSTHQLHHFVTQNHDRRIWLSCEPSNIWTYWWQPNLCSSELLANGETLGCRAFQIGFSNGLGSLRFGKKSENSKTRRKKHSMGSFEMYMCVLQNPSPNNKSMKDSRRTRNYMIEETG